MTEPPRRLPLTHEERVRNAISRMASGSDAGQSRFAGPVQQAGSSSSTDSGTPTFDRIQVTAHIPYASLTGGAIGVDTWDSVVEQVGDSLSLNSPDDGGIYALDLGVYAVNATLAANGIDGAPSNCVIALFTFESSVIGGRDGLLTVAKVRGGDPILSTAPRWGASSSETYYTDGDPAFGDSWTFGLRYLNLDPAVTSVDVEVSVALVSG